MESAVMISPKPEDFADALNGLLHASYRLTAAHTRNPKRTKTPATNKRQAVDRLFRLVFGRPATEAEHVVVGTAAYAYGGFL